MKAGIRTTRSPPSKSAQDTNTDAGREVEEHELGDRPTKGGKDMKAEGRDSKTGTMTTESRDSKTGDTQTKGAARPTTQDQTTGNAATSATAAPPAEKRTQIVSAIRSEKIQETTNVNFNISVGAVVPATRPLPPASAPDRRNLSGVARL